MGITEVNSLAPHYRCPKCQYSQFNDDNGEPLGNSCKDGFDLPDKKCPKCGTRMHKMVMIFRFKLSLVLMPIKCQILT